ncbi:MAG: SCO family protein [Proteobacteria bacterium]|nr:SCO family protein [Pseudomonadota bacterium]MBU1738870.1 SCO family protein [Pseudomonadota bacterium]
MKHFYLIVAFFIFLTAIAVTDAGASAGKYERSLARVAIPDVVLVNQRGEKVRIKSLLEADEPVIVDFIYATCTTICPILSAGFANLQTKYGPEIENVRLVSISIDPENDTPKVMQEYLGRYEAQAGWDFLSGSRMDIDMVMKAFDAYFRDKMDHQPLNFVRSVEDGRWLRLYGLMSSRDLINELQKMRVK